MKASCFAAFAATAALSGASAWAHPGGHGPDTRKAHAATEKEYGRPGDATRAARTVHLELGERMQLTPSQWQVKQGETVKFVARNSAKTPQRLAVATLKEFQEQSAMLKKFPEMRIAAANQVEVPAGETRELVWQFTRPGEFSLGSPEHPERVGKISVTAR